VITAAWFLVKSKWLQGSWALDWKFIKYAWQEALPLTLTMLFVNVYFRIDITLLTRLRSAVEVGWYGAAHKCIEVLMIVPAILMAATFPGMARLHVENPEKLKSAVQILLRLLLLLACPMLAGAPFVAEPLMTLLFGQEFSPAGIDFVFLVIALGFIYFNFVFTFLLISARKQTINAILAAGAVVVCIAANLLLIPRYGHTGAALAASLTEGYLLLAYALASRPLLHGIRWLPDFARVSASALLMAGLLFLFKEQTIFIKLALAVAGYGLAVWLLGAIRKEDINLLQRAFSKVRT
jgi:O-antigen/teichoic acid export membrane protein